MAKVKSDAFPKLLGRAFDSAKLLNKKDRLIYLIIVSVLVVFTIVLVYGGHSTRTEVYGAAGGVTAAGNADGNIVKNGDTGTDGR